MDRYKDVLDEIREFFYLPPLLEPLSPLQSPTLSSDDEESESNVPTDRPLSMPTLSSLSVFDQVTNDSNIGKPVITKDVSCNGTGSLKSHKVPRVKRKAYNKKREDFSIDALPRRLMQLVSRSTVTNENITQSLPSPHLRFSSADLISLSTSHSPSPSPCSPLSVSSLYSINYNHPSPSNSPSDSSDTSSSIASRSSTSIPHPMDKVHHPLRFRRPRMSMPKVRKDKLGLYKRFHQILQLSACKDISPVSNSCESSLASECTDNVDDSSIVCLDKLEKDLERAIEEQKDSLPEDDWLETFCQNIGI